jgi:RNA polymerase sigma factor (sigma-70 family)
MSTTIDWVAAAAEEEVLERKNETKGGVAANQVAVEDLPAHSFPGKAEVDHPSEYHEEAERQRRIYRARTVAMLRRYMRYSIETGRLPSLLGREFFRSKVTSYSVTTFEDRVIFVHDMEICLAKLDEFSREILARIVLQEYEHDEAASLLGCTRMTVHRRLIEALDKLSNILLTVRLLEDISGQAGKSCQEGKTDTFLVSDCKYGEKKL